MRFKSHPAVAIDHFHRLQYADELLRRILLFNARRLNQEDKRAGAAVHDGHFRPIDFDMAVIDTQPRERRHQVFDGGDFIAVFDEGRRKLGFPHIKGMAGNFNRLRQINPVKDDAGIRRRRAQRQTNLLARVQANAGRSDAVTKGTLVNQGGAS